MLCINKYLVTISSAGQVVCYRSKMNKNQRQWRTSESALLNMYFDDIKFIALADIKLYHWKLRNNSVSSPSQVTEPDS